MLSVFYLGTLPWGKGLGFVPLGHRCPKCEECPRPSNLYSSKFKILYIENFSTTLGISRNPEPLGFWPQIKRSRIPDKNEKSIHLLGLLQLSEGISPLPAEGFMVPQTYNQPWGTFPLLSCIWCTLGVRVFRSLLSPVEYGWYLDMTCLCLVLLCNCGLFWGLSGNQGPCRDHRTCRSGKPMESGWESPIFLCGSALRRTTSSVSALNSTKT